MSVLLLTYTQTVTAAPGHKYENGQIDQLKFEKAPLQENTAKAHAQGWAKFAFNGNENRLL